MNPQEPNQPNEQPQDTTPVEPSTETPVENTTPVEQPIQQPVEAPAANPFGPAPAPTDPAAAAPVANQAPIGGQPTAPKKSNKKIALIAGIVGGLVLIGAVAAGLFLSMKNVSTADYKAAYDQLVVVRNAASKTPTNAGVSGSAEDKIQETEENYAAFKTESAKLADLKAFKGDDELKALFETYKTKYEAYVAYNDAFLPSVSALAETRDEVDALGSGSSLLTTANIQKLVDIYKKLATDASNPSIKTFAESSAAAYTEVLPQVTILEASGSTSSEKLAASRAISASTRKATAAGSTLSKELSEKSKEVSLSDALNDLGTATTKKYNDKK